MTDDPLAPAPLPLPAPSPAEAYLDAARAGRTHWLRFVLGMIAIVACFGVLAALIGLGVFLVARFGGIQLSPDADPIVFMLIPLAMLAAMVPLIGLVMRLVHKRPLLSLVTPTGHLDGRRLRMGFLVWGGLLAAWIAIDFTVNGTWRAPYLGADLLLFGLATLALVPFQAATEELIFRGYLTQAFGLLARNAWIGALVAAPIFGIAHYGVGGPYAYLYYALFGLGFSAIALLDGRLELAIGAHAANNVMALVVLRSGVSPFDTPAMWVEDGPDVIDLAQAAPQLAIFVLFILVTRRLLRGGRG